jgi:hypothetical protein
MGGDGHARQWKTHPNIILLTAKEHFVAHKLLYFIYPNNKSVFHGYRMMAKMEAKTNNRSFNLSAREYEEIRVEFSKSVSGENAPSKRPEVAKKISESQRGKIISDETKLKVTEGLKKYHKENPGIQKGRKMTEETKQKLSNSHKGKSNPNSINAMIKANKGKKRSLETIEKLRIAALNRKPMSDETKRKISESVTKIQTGRPCSEETKLKISKTLTGHVKYEKGKKYS